MISTQRERPFLACPRHVALPATARVSRFTGRDGTRETHLTVIPTEYADIGTQLSWLSAVYAETMASLGLSDASAVFRRLFCSDLANQAVALRQHPLADQWRPDGLCATSWVSQPPVPPAKVALWAYHLDGARGTVRRARHGASTVWQHGELAHIWTTGLVSPLFHDAYDQTMGILHTYDALLAAQGLTLADHVMRTWLFARDIDTDYRSMADARTAFFAERGLTADTHYIASTGIAGASSDTRAKVLLDAYAIAGVRPAQVRYLRAAEQMCPTHQYGVTFERGVAIAFRDRARIFISGTASITRRGHVQHAGHPLRQLDRALDHIAALLREAGATPADIGVLLAYARDPSDLCLVREAMAERFPEVPTQVLLAPVCRPGWLVEVECQATVAQEHPGLPVF